MYYFGKEKGKKDFVNTKTQTEHIETLQENMYNSLNKQYIT